MKKTIDEKLIYEYIGRKIKDQREVNTSHSGKITQEHLAQALGVTRVSIANYEAGKQAVSLADLYKIADYFQVDVKIFLPPLEEVILMSPEEKLEEAGNLSKVEKEAIRKLISTDIGGDDEG